MHNFLNFKTWIQKELIKADFVLEEDATALLYKKFLAGLQSNSDPHLIIISGICGAGKTFYRKNHYNLSLADNYYIQDMDEVLISLPQYQQAYRQYGALSAFKSWWPTGQFIADYMASFAIQNNFNIIYDRTCGSERSFLTIRNSKTNNYLIKLHALYVKIPIALERVANRVKTDNRLIPSELTIEYGRRFSTLWPYYLALVDEAYLYDNNRFDYTLIGEWHKVREMIFQPALYQQFLNMKYSQEELKYYFPNLIFKDLGRVHHSLAK